jgi:hypothetical protein
VVIVVALSRSTVRQTSTGSSRRVLVWNTRHCPPFRPMKLAHWAAPCMSGGSGIIRSGNATSAAFLATSSYELTASHVRMLRPPMHDMNTSCWRHSTPLGMPVVPPV